MHTDRGSAYTSDEFRTEFRTGRLRQSMGRVGSCHGNAAAESGFAVLEAEIGTTVWETREAARADVFRYIETDVQPQPTPQAPEYGYLTPLETRTSSGRASFPQRKHPLPRPRGELHPPWGKAAPPYASDSRGDVVTAASTARDACGPAHVVSSAA